VTRKAATIRDVALRAGVSVATASNVVNGNRPVGEESRSKVLQAVAALSYRLNRAASSLRGASSRLIGMVVPDIANVFFGELVRDVEELAENDGYDLLLVTTSEDPAIERRRIEALVSRRIDGLLVVPARDNTVASLLSGPDGAFMPPTVLIDRGDPSSDLDTVSADCDAGAYAATRHLIGLGHRDVAVLAHTTQLKNITARIDGYRRALADSGLRGRERICVGGHSLDTLRGAVELELHRADPPTAIFGLTNVSALAAIKAARGLGLDIPGDVSIVGFDDFDWMLALRPYLTTVAQPIGDFAARSWRRLIDRINGEGEPPGLRIELPCTLKVRESTGPARARLKSAAAT
jgi:LacI family transcriptional regulator